MAGGGGWGALNWFHLFLCRGLVASEQFNSSRPQELELFNTPDIRSSKVNMVLNVHRNHKA